MAFNISMVFLVIGITFIFVSIALAAYGKPPAINLTTLIGLFFSLSSRILFKIYRDANNRLDRFNQRLLENKTEEKNPTTEK